MKQLGFDFRINLPQDPADLIGSLFQMFNIVHKCCRWWLNKAEKIVNMVFIEIVSRDIGRFMQRSQGRS